MCESSTNNSLASWDSSMWSKEEKKKRGARFCARNSFPFLPKNWAHTSRLSLCRLAAASRTDVHAQMPANMAPTSCLWLNTRLGFCRPKHKKEAQNGASTSAILGLLKSVISLLHLDKEKTVVVPSTVKSQCADPDDTQKTVSLTKLSRE